MEIYDFEFDFRLDIIAAALKHKTDQTVELKVVPFRSGECAECPWWDHCRPQLEAGAGDVSLLPRVTWTQWRIHRDSGVTDRAALASLDHRTATLIADGVDLADLMANAAGAAPETPVAALPKMARRAKQLEVLAAAGITTVADLATLDARTLAYSGTGFSALPEQIDRACAALGPDPVYRRRGVHAVVVPRADVEVDVDMENVEDGVYLWGALVSDCDASAYHGFATWEPLDARTEGENFMRFWRWLMESEARALEAGRTWRAYCWHEQAENQHLRRLGLAGGVAEEVEAFIAIGRWVDLRRVFDVQLITGGSTGLKTVAPLARFTWEVDDPGGGESMVWYDNAARGDEEARAWLLTYNEGDVRATRAVRAWLTTAGNIPSIGSR